MFFKELIQSEKWKNRALEIYKDGAKKPSSYDCDVRREAIRKEMEDSGLKLGKDFVVVHGYLDGRRHTFLELYGKNNKPHEGYQINGYIIDPANPKGKGKFKKIWKGEYQE